mgnify:CR=1 FL=1
MFFSVTSPSVRIDAPVVVKPLTVSKKAVDSRKKDNVFFVYNVCVELDCDESSVIAHSKNSKVAEEIPYKYEMPEIRRTSTLRPVIAGFGPAGFFAALIVMAPHYSVNEGHLRVLADTPVWLVACKNDITATYSTMSKAFWNTLRDTTNVPSACRFTTFEKYNYYDAASHAVQFAVANDLLNQPSDCGMSTVNAKGGTVATNEGESIITWLSSFRLGETEKEDICHCDCHSSKGFTKFIWSIKCFFWRIFAQSRRACECGANHW